MAYQYTAAKKEAANKKYSKRKTASKKSVGAKKPAVGKKVMTGQKRSSKVVKKVSNKAKKLTGEGKKAQLIKKQKRDKVITGLISGGVVIVLLLLIWVLLWQFLFSAIFPLHGERNLLIVGAKPDQEADVMYILRLDQESEVIKVFSLDAAAMVGVAGGYGEYPLGNIAPFLHLGEHDQSELVAIYNYALGQAIDEVIFVDEAVNPDGLPEIREAFWTLLKEQLGQTGTIESDLLEAFFHLQKDYPLLVETVDVAGAGEMLDDLNKEVILGCPVVLINTTMINGLASKVSVMLETNGALVVNYDSSNEDLQDNVIYYDENEASCEQLLQIIKNSLPNIGEIIADQGKMGQENRAKMVIKLGESLSAE